MMAMMILQEIYLLIFGMAIYSSLLHIKEDLIDFIEKQLNTDFSFFYIPTQDISIDELLRKFKGRTRHKQYEPSKSAKRGLYCYAMVDNSNYLLRFKMRKA